MQDEHHNRKRNIQKGAFAAAPLVVFFEAGQFIEQDDGFVRRAVLISRIFRLKEPSMIRTVLGGLLLAVALIAAGCAAPTPTPTATPTATATPTPSPTPKPRLVTLDQAREFAIEVRLLLEDGLLAEEIRELDIDNAELMVDVLCEIADGVYEPDLTLEHVAGAIGTIRGGVQMYCTPITFTGTG